MTSRGGLGPRDWSTDFCNSLLFRIVWKTLSVTLNSIMEVFILQHSQFMFTAATPQCLLHLHAHTGQKQRRNRVRIKKVYTAIYTTKLRPYGSLAIEKVVD